MAELLVKATNQTHPDAVRDRRGTYKRGMIVGVQKDGHVWGLKERLPKFVVIKIPGLALPRVRELLSPQTEDDDGVDDADIKKRKVFRRRRWRLVWADLPGPIKAQLANNGEVTVSKAQLRNYLKRIRDNLTYTGMD